MDRIKESPTRLLDVGEKAPGFSLRDQDGRVVNLVDYLGKKNVVLIFYPADKTPGCTKQLCAVRDRYEDFGDADTVVFGVNPQSAASHQKFVEKYEFPFALLVDSDKRVVMEYGCKGALSTKRTVYGINKDGVIAFAQRGKPSTEEILRAFTG